MAPKHKHSRLRKHTAVTSQATSDVPRRFIGPPNLPLEVILSIFESSTRKEMLVLCRVSKACQSWIYPLLYHTIVLRRGETCRLFQRTVNTFHKSDTHASFLATHTKVLIILPTANTTDYRLNDILIACSNITTFSVRSKIVAKDMSRFENFQCLTHLNMPDLFNSNKILPAGLTHVNCNVNGWSDIIETYRWSLFLRQNPRITHLALDIPSDFFSGRARNAFLPVLALLPPTLVRIIIIFTSYQYSRPYSDDVRLETGRFSESQRTVWVKLVEKYGDFGPPAPIKAMLGWDYQPVPGMEDIWELGDRIARCSVS